MKKHNAHCPICQTSWNFNTRFAILEEVEKNELQQHGSLFIVCEGCDHDQEAIEKAQNTMEKVGRGVYFTR